MTYLVDTNHISILQRQSGLEFTTLMAHIAQHGQTELAFSIISMHEQVLGCHTYISRARTTSEVVRGYRMLAQILQDFAVSPVLPFDAAAATVFDGLVSQGVRIDLRIASIALSRGMVLVTRKMRDFGRVPELQIEDWTV